MSFQTRLQNWRLSHPSPSVATGNQAHFQSVIQTEADRIVSAQFKAADRIIVSQHDVAARIDNARASLEAINDGLEGLASVFDWGLSEILWHLEQTREELAKIIELLEAPLTTQARELRRRAVFAYQSGWIEDAIRDFLEAEKKNVYDFTVHQNLGNLFFFHKQDPATALKYYEKAAKYAAPRSRYHAAYAQLHIGLVKYLQDKISDACEATARALELEPTLLEAHYQHAQYCARCGRYDEAQKHLQIAVEGDRRYCLKISSENDFNVMREGIESWFESLRADAREKAQHELDTLERFVTYSDSSGLLTTEALTFIREKGKEARELFERDTLFDYQDAIVCALDAQEGELAALRHAASDEHEALEQDISNVPEWVRGTAKNVGKVCSLVVVTASIVVWVLRVLAEIITGGQVASAVVLGALSCGCLAAGGAALVYVLGWSLGWIICKLIAEGRKRRDRSRLKELENVLSQVETLWNEVNWEYKKHNQEG